jgi:dihydropteroate synthase
MGSARAVAGIAVEKLKIWEGGRAGRLAREVWGADDVPPGFSSARGTILRFRGLSAGQGRALLQAAAATGAQAVVHRDCALGRAETTEALAAGAPQSLRRMADGLTAWGEEAAELARAFLGALAGEFAPGETVWKCRERILTTGRRTLIMGVVNVTPDSFSDGGLFLDPGRAIRHSLQLLEEGADILDFGAESTRPGAQPVAAEEEARRLRPIVQALRGQTAAPLSIDTSKSAVAREMLDLGADIINDITALRGDPAMAAVCARAKAGVVLMHMQGDPRTMQLNPTYEDVVGEIVDFLGRRIGAALEAGIAEEGLAVDPGIGFGKTVEHNLRLVAHAGAFGLFGRPVLMGVSRKSFIGKVLNVEIHDRLEGTAAAVAASALQGVSIVRVHDVKAMRRVVNLLDAVLAAR